MYLWIYFLCVTLKTQAMKKIMETLTSEPVHPNPNLGSDNTFGSHWSVTAKVYAQRRCMEQAARLASSDDFFL